jgi:midasin
MLIEDIDKAPMEVLSILIPLLETRRLFVSGRGEVIDAADGFQLFATQTLRSSTVGTQSTRNGERISHLRFD